MTVTFGSVGTFLTYASRTNSPLVVPVGVAAGDVLVAYLYADDSNPTITPATGFTEITFSTVPNTFASSPQLGVHVYWKRASGADTGTYTFNHAAAKTQGQVVRYRGALASGTPVIPYNGANRTSSGSTTPAIAYSTSRDNEMLSFYGGIYTSVSFTLPTSWTQDGNGNGEIICHQLIATAGTLGSVSASAGGSAAAIAALVSILSDVSAYTPTITANPLGLTDSLTGAINHNYAPTIAAESLGLTDGRTTFIGKLASPSEVLTGADSFSVVQTDHPAPADEAIIREEMTATLIFGDLQDFQFQPLVEPRVLFGRDLTLVVSEFIPGSLELRNQDEDSPLGDYRIFGTDRRTPPVWGWSIWTNTYTPEDSLGWLDLITQIWDNPVRRTPGGVIPLRYTLAGRTRRVYGRPRRFTAVPDRLNMGRIHITADFALAEDAYYDEDEQSITVPMAAEWAASTGIILPATVPWRFTTGVAPRTSTITVGGTKATWLQVTIAGPVSYPWVQIGEMRFPLNGSVAAGQTIVLSGRSWDAGVLRSDGAWVPGMLDPRSRLAALLVEPDDYSVTYGGTDNTGTSRCTVSWRNNNRSL